MSGQYKKTWEKAYGSTPVIARGNSSLAMIEADALRLKDGGEQTYYEADKEIAVVILGGRCAAAGDGFDFGEIGARETVFDGPATAFYVPKGRTVTITAVGELWAVVSKAPAERDFEPALIRPQDVRIRELGKDGWQRQAHFIIDERVGANLFYIGEAFVSSGMWASYPPHKHDEDKMPAETVSEEVYYYEFDKPQGFGVQRVYTKEGDIDQTCTVRSGDFVEIPRGYHPFACAPGYNSYYLWIMAGKNRGFFMTTEEGHRWLTK